ncbi:MAG: PLDc N-terminal domain-containing protein [Mailhella sp.]|nr:PLDc N-terminal domain-containing protein [Mailhella sp.]
MGLFDLSAGTLVLLGLPALINIWSIWHASRHVFPGEKEQLLWILAGVFFPVLGGIAYLLFGLRRAK